MVPVSGWTFALPPSVSEERVQALAQPFAELLADAGFALTVSLRTYELLERALQSGEVDAAWGPPLVCARAEANGGSVPLRAIRRGATTYRSALVCRAGDDLSIANLAGRRPRAAWVDTWAMAGYILPRHHLRSCGFLLERALAAETLTGSYESSFAAVLDGKADLTASYSSGRGLGYVELTGARAFSLRTLAYTEESPNDALVTSPRLGAAARAEICGALDHLVGDERRRKAFATIVGADGFDRPPSGTYRPLLSLL